MATRTASRSRPVRKTSARKRSRASTDGAAKGEKTGARAIWKGIITFGTLTVPVKLYSAIQDQSIHFRMLDAKTVQPVRQRMIDAGSGEVVEGGAVHKALQVSARKMVVIEDAELEKSEPRESRDIDIGRFVARGKIAHQFYQRAYWVGPDGESEKYFSLVEALRNQDAEGVARWVMRKKEYAGSLRVSGDHLMLITLRSPDEVVDASKLSAPAGREPTERELAMARTLLGSMVGTLDMTEFRDTYRDRVLELVKAKAAGKMVKFPRAKAKPAEDTSLEDLLKRSIGRKSA